MLLSPHEPWHVVAITAAVGVASKYLVRTRSANVFNPAALGIVATFYVFDTGQSWWGALGDAASDAVMLFATGIFITDRVNKMPLVLAFLATYYLLFTPTAFVGDPRARRRDLPATGPAGGALLRVLHPDRPADVAGQVTGPDHLRRDRGSRELRRLRVDRRGLLPARRRPRGERVGSRAPGAEEATIRRGAPARRGPSLSCAALKHLARSTQPQHSVLHLRPHAAGLAAREDRVHDRIRA